MADLARLKDLAAEEGWRGAAGAAYSDALQEAGDPRGCAIALVLARWSELEEMFKKIEANELALRARGKAIANYPLRQVGGTQLYVTVVSERVWRAIGTFLSAPDPRLARSLWGDVRSAGRGMFPADHRSELIVADSVDTGGARTSAVFVGGSTYEQEKLGEVLPAGLCGPFVRLVKDVAKVFEAAKTKRMTVAEDAIEILKRKVAGKPTFQFRDAAEAYLEAQDRRGWGGGWGGRRIKDGRQVTRWLYRIAKREMVPGKGPDTWVPVWRMK